MPLPSQVRILYPLCGTAMVSGYGTLVHGNPQRIEYPHITLRDTRGHDVSKEHWTLFPISLPSLDVPCFSLQHELCTGPSKAFLQAACRCTRDTVFLHVT